MRIAFLLLIIVHAVIHIFWFAHSFGWADLAYFQKDIPGMVGFSWLLSALFFIASAVQLWKRKLNWFHPALIGVLISQMWIFSNWEDTKLGSLANLVIMAGILVGYSKSRFEGLFLEDVQATFENLRISGTPLQEEDLEHLPAPVQQYIRRSGALGKPRIENFFLEFEGEMRREGAPWFGFTSRQYNFVPRPKRFFFMKARVKGISTEGYHSYEPPRAGMVVKALSMFPVVRTDAPEMFPTESVTFLNDLCLFAPGALVDDRLTWEPLDSHKVRVLFSIKTTTVSAILYFDASGDLVDFKSEDRLNVDKNRRYPFSTPVRDYREFSGIRVPSYGEAVWHYPDGEFVYGKFRVKAISYNVTGLPA